MMVISDNVDIISIEWLWESLLAGPLTKHSLLSESESSVSTAMFHCKLCRFDTISIDNFRAHLLSDEKHAQEEKSIFEFNKYCIQNARRCRLAEYDRHHCPDRQR
ncbi:PREDICTED: uncharacterized protein LOC106332914 isoform X2 [Brassica oleracea var. oleracea]|uniref:uncharacterized protein LOC106332914 isoform X2 n=1 Tax=Brassica oleracea var. oleracea TaxID=109376 RepID=UPI0006A70E3C|nr:PREDICTED: uncharacterized protein LOC106332914 isoform X2 [Brassica oleracea var. oleracea]